MGFKIVFGQPAARFIDKGPMLVVAVQQPAAMKRKCLGKNQGRCARAELYNIGWAQFLNRIDNPVQVKCIRLPAAKMRKPAAEGSPYLQRPDEASGERTVYRDGRILIGKGQTCECNLYRRTNSACFFDYNRPAVGQPPLSGFTQEIISCGKISADRVHLCPDFRFRHGRNGECKFHRCFLTPSSGQPNICHGFHFRKIELRLDDD